MKQQEPKEKAHAQENHGNEAVTPYEMTSIERIKNGTTEITIG
jgi:hypothetical protein